MDYLEFIATLLLIWILSDLVDGLFTNWHNEYCFRFIVDMSSTRSDDFVGLLYKDLFGKTLGCMNDAKNVEEAETEPEKPTTEVQ